LWSREMVEKVDGLEERATKGDEPCRRKTPPPSVELKSKREREPEGEGAGRMAAPGIKSDGVNGNLPTRATSEAALLSCRPGKRDNKGRGNNKQPAPLPILKDGHVAWEIDCVLQKKGSKVLIKWVGFGREEATWEPIANIPKHFIDCYRGGMVSKTRRVR